MRASRVNSLSVALRAGYLSVRTAEGASEKWTYLLTYLKLSLNCNKIQVKVMLLAKTKSQNLFHVNYIKKRKLFCEVKHYCRYLVRTTD